MDICNKSNKKILLGSRQLTDETDPKTLGIREESRENIFTDSTTLKNIFKEDAIELKPPLDIFLKDIRETVVGNIFNKADESIMTKRTLDYGPVRQGSKRTK